MRRLLGLLLVAFGSGLLLFVGSAYARGAVARERARSAWEAAAARADVQAAYAAAEAAPVHEPVSGAPMARLRIPAIGLDEVVLEGIGDRELLAGPGHLPGTPLPGAAGNSILSAHRDRHFRSLDELQIGDTIRTETRQHNVTWVVSERKVLHRTAPALFSTSDPTLTLTTCWPVRYFGTAPERLLIVAKPAA